MKGINIAKKLDNIKELLGKLPVNNKGKVLRDYLVDHMVEITNQHGQHRPLQRRVEAALQGCAVLHSSTNPTASR
jgi:hypothetical protein